MVQAKRVPEFMNCRPQDVRFCQGSNFSPPISMVVIDIARLVSTSGKVGLRFCFGAAGARIGTWFKARRRVRAIDVSVVKPNLSLSPIRIISHHDRTTFV